jgi:hypothetical protein
MDSASCPSLMRARKSSGAGARSANSASSASRRRTRARASEAGSKLGMGHPSIAALAAIRASRPAAVDDPQAPGERRSRPGAFREGHGPPVERVPVARRDVAACARTVRPAPGSSRRRPRGRAREVSDGDDRKRLNAVWSCRRSATGEASGRSSRRSAIATLATFVQASDRRSHDRPHGSSRVWLPIALRETALSVIIGSPRAVGFAGWGDREPIGHAHGIFEAPAPTVRSPVDRRGARR